MGRRLDALGIGSRGLPADNFFLVGIKEIE